MMSGMNRVRGRRALTGAIAALIAPIAVFGGAGMAHAAPESTAPDSQQSGAEIAEQALYGAAPLATDGAQEVTGGTFSWGVRQSIRNYLENFEHTEGSVTASNGASYKKGDDAAVFPVASGTVDPDADTASLKMDGELEMRGFDSPWLHFDDLRLEVADGTATLTVDMLESFNVDTETDDLVISTWSVDDLKLTDGQLEMTTEQGKFSNTVAVDHLPSYGGPTYASPNDYTDPFTLKLQTGGGENPATGPYGTSTGTAYSDNTAVIRVTPGYALNADGETEITIEGSGFSPGTEAAPANLYVGIGAMSDPSNPEKWRRSQGGSSGKLGVGDYDYGSPQMVASVYSEDADVANGAMDENGSWTLTLTLPSKSIKSYFGGDAIDCVASGCGVFAFGAHGMVNAKNEAYTPIFFDGQDETEWPDRDNGDDDGGDDGGTDTPTPVPPTPTPTPVDPSEKTCEPNGENSTTNAAGATLTVSPAKCLGDSEQTVTVRGTGYPTSNDGSTFGGVYLMFGWVDRDLGDGKWGPSEGGRSGIDYTYAKDGVPAGTYQTMVNYPGNTTEPDVPYMDENGDWETELPIKESRFVSIAGTEIDCYEVTCGVITVGAHGKVNGAGEAFTPIYFTGTAEETGTGRPETPSSQTPTANPNAQQTATTQTTAGGPLASTGTRNLVVYGVLILSAAAFAFSLVRLRRPQRAVHR